jgi:hypothetical protein
MDKCLCGNKLPKNPTFNNGFCHICNRELIKEYIEDNRI